MSTEELPLAGVRVVELTIAIAAPSVGQVLSDYGAEVVKVEPPSGDTQRYMVSGLTKGNSDPYKDAPHFYHVNRGKRSVVLDVKTDPGMEAMHALLEGADVFVSNLRVPALRRLGLTSEAILARHPRLVVCAMSGYGAKGPEADRPGYDVACFWARSGAAAAHTGADGYPPVLVPGFGDMATGLAAVGGICAALLQRTKTGRGRVVETNLLRVGLHCNAWASSTFFAKGRTPSWGSRDRTGNPMFTCYKAKDGKTFWLIGAEATRHWPSFAKAVGRPEWIEDVKYKTASDRGKRQKELVDHLDEIFATRTREEWAQVFDDAGLWWAPVQDAGEVAEDLQAIAQGAFLDAPVSEKAKAAGRDRVTMVAAPVDFPGSSIGPRRPTPELGEHTEEVVRELGLRESTLQAVLSAARSTERRSKL